VIACNNRGVCRLRRRDWDGAVQDLARAVELSPEQWQGWASYGQALAGQGRREPALEALRKARALAPPEMHARLDADIARLGAKG
jgi:Flp pilus assembly protein TadD